jgi:methylated-DNA-[protein]-cysteine S-methyltransferase
MTAPAPTSRRAPGTHRAGTTWWTMTPSPVGPLLLLGDGVALRGLYTGADRDQPPGDDCVEDAAPLRDAVEQLDAYWAGERVAFDLALAPVGTPFQRTVWDALCEIPFGATWSYGELAAHVGRPGSARAVGRANGSNPISIVVPCHRVIGSTGALVGYGGGLDRKRALLAHEADVLRRRGERPPGRLL